MCPLGREDTEKLSRSCLRIALAMHLKEYSVTKLSPGKMFKYGIHKSLPLITSTFISLPCGKNASAFLRACVIFSILSSIGLRFSLRMIEGVRCKKGGQTAGHPQGKTPNAHEYYCSLCLCVSDKTSEGRQLSGTCYEPAGDDQE